jgi:putative tryptophan/tyrosine transport system substrate-binding protein
MHKKFRLPFGFLSSDNRKSESGPADENLKWLGIFAIVLTFVLGGAVVEAQQPKKVPLIGYISATDAATDSIRAEAIRTGLREFGYIEGQTIDITYRYADGKRDRYPDLVAELVRLKVDIILIAGGDPLIRAAMSATKSIPIVMAGPGSDPVRAGHVESLARPGGNVTGLTALNRELGGSGWSCSKKRYPNFPVSRFSTIRPICPVYTR